MVDPKFNNNNHLIEDLKDDNSSEINPIRDAISGFRKGEEKDPLKEKMMKILFIIALVTVIFLIILFIFSKIFGGNKSYSDIENIMINASKNYYKENKSLLPKTAGGVVEVSAQKLANLNYMKNLDQYAKNKNCSGKVVVENNDDNYVYTSYLDCGNDYKTMELYREITASENLVTTGDGLYRNGMEYLFRGENVNNYVMIDGQLWRIVKINQDNQVMLIKDDRLDTIYSLTWDDRYNESKKYRVGINDFSVSRIKEVLNSLFLRKEEKNALFSSNTKNYIVSHSFCIGKRDLNSSEKNEGLDCSVMSEPLKLGLLTVSDYMNASLDSGCTTFTSRTCQNYNYLVNKDMDWWLATASSSNSYEVYYVQTNGVIAVSNASSYKTLRPVIYLTSKTMFKSGDGTSDNPYIIK